MNLVPGKDQYAPFYQGYVGKAGTGNIMDTMRQEMEGIHSFLSKVPLDKWNYRYAEGKWSIKEIVLHLIDSERVFAYRAMRIARNDQTPLPGFEQDDYVPVSEAGGRSPASLMEEYLSVRRASLTLFENFSEVMWTRKGTASGNTCTPLALAFILVGHQRHHFDILSERYLHH